MVDCTQLATMRTRLSEAEAAEHDIMTGQGVRRWIDQNGESVEYSRANLTQLQAYIQRLRNDIQVCEGTRTTYTGPLRFNFGRRRY